MTSFKSEKAAAARTKTDPIDAQSKKRRRQAHCRNHSLHRRSLLDRRQDLSA